MNNIFDIINNYENINNIMDFLDYEYDDDNLEGNARERIFQPHINYFDVLNDKLFEERFRIPKSVFIMILERIEHVIRHVSDRYVHL